MDTLGLRDLRQDASRLVRRVEQGEQSEIAISGRLGTRLVPAAPRRWRQWAEIAELLTGRADPEWTATWS